MKRQLTLEQLQNVCVDTLIGITAFNSIVIALNKDSQTERLICFLKSLTEFEVHHLLAVSDRKGGVSFLWSEVPPRFRDISDIEIPDGDVWSIYNNMELSSDGSVKTISGVFVN